MAKKTDNCPICGRVMEKSTFEHWWPTTPGGRTYVSEDAIRLACDGDTHSVIIHLRREEPTDANA